MDVSTLEVNTATDNTVTGQTGPDAWNHMRDLLALAPAYNVAEIITGAWEFAPTTNIISQRNGTNAQTFRVYGSDGTRRIELGHDGVNATLASDGSAGALAVYAKGASSGLYLGGAYANHWNITSSGHLLAGGAYNIGDDAGSSPLNITAENNVKANGGIIGNRIYGDLSAAKASLRSPTDGIWQMANNAETDFTRLILGTNDASGVGFRKLGAALEVVTGDSSANASLLASVLTVTQYFEGSEIADPAAPSANKGRFYFKDNGSGKTQLAVRFPTGAVQILSTEP